MVRKGGVNRRGFSPVIASVLLILMVLVLAAMIFLWARTFFINQTENSEQLKIEELCSFVNFNAMLNDEGSVLEVVNKGNVNISAFEIKTYSGGDSEIVEINISVSAGESARQGVDFGDINSFDKIEIFPVLVDGVSSKKSIICSKDSAFLLDF